MNGKISIKNSQDYKFDVSVFICHITFENLKMR